MGRRGPAPKPTQLRLLHGDKPDRFNPREPIPREALPKPPPGLARDVLDVWNYTLAELVAMGTVAACDRDSLVCYCEAVVAHRKASAVLAQSTVLIKGLHGGLVRNPALQVQRDAAQVVRAFAQEFGLTPSGRTRIQTEARGNASGSNPFAALG